MAVQGRRRAVEGQLEMLAWTAAAIINHRTPAMGEKHRKPITPNELLGRKKQQRTFATKAELEAHMAEQEAEGFDDWDWDWGWEQ